MDRRREAAAFLLACAALDDALQAPARFPRLFGAPAAESEAARGRRRRRDQHAARAKKKAQRKTRKRTRGW